MEAYVTLGFVADQQTLFLLKSIYPGSVEVIRPLEGCLNSSGIKDDAQLPVGPGRIELKIKVDIEFDREIGFILVDQSNNLSDSTRSLNPETPEASPNQTTIKTKTFPPILVHLDLSAGYPLSEAPTVKGVTDWKVQDRLTHPITPTLATPQASSSSSSSTANVPKVDSSYLPESVRGRISSQLQDLWEGSGGEGVLWTWMDWVREGGAILEGLEKSQGGDHEGYM